MFRFRFRFRFVDFKLPVKGLAHTIAQDNTLSNMHTHSTQYHTLKMSQETKVPIIYRNYGKP